MAYQDTRTRIRWGVVVAVAAGIALGGVLSERVEQRIAERTEERASTRAAQPEPPSDKSCTDGIDCYCDKIKPGGPFYDPNVLLCEDYEAITLHEDVGKGNYINAGGENVHGPWYDETGTSDRRGFNNYYGRTYGPPVSQCVWPANQPASPIVGVTCKPGGTGGCWHAEYRLDDRWQGNAYACIDVLRDGEFDDELVTNPEPVVPGKHSGTFDGLQSFGHRIRAGATQGIVGQPAINGAPTEISFTMAVAYPDNSLDPDATLWTYPWKGIEAEAYDVNGGKGEFAFFGHNVTSFNCSVPYNLSLKPVTFGGAAATQCNAAIAGANLRLGTWFCTSDGRLYPKADCGVYNAATDFPLNTWHCLQVHHTNFGTTNYGMKAWVNEQLVLDFDGFDGTFLGNRGGYHELQLNAYANRNQTGDTTSETTYRYEDNLHIRTGPPVSCQQLGFQ